MTVTCLDCLANVFFTVSDLPNTNERVNIRPKGVSYINPLFIYDYENFLTYDIPLGKRKKTYINQLIFSKDMEAYYCDFEQSFANWVLPPTQYTRSVLDIKTKMTIYHIRDDIGYYSDYEYFPFQFEYYKIEADPLDLEHDLWCLEQEEKGDFSLCTKVMTKIGEGVVLPQDTKFKYAKLEPCKTNGHTYKITVEDKERKCMFCFTDLGHSKTKQAKRLDAMKEVFLEQKFLDVIRRNSDSGLNH